MAFVSPYQTKKKVAASLAAPQDLMRVGETKSEVWKRAKWPIDTIATGGSWGPSGGLPWLLGGSKDPQLRRFQSVQIRPSSTTLHRGKIDQKRPDLDTRKHLVCE